MIDKGNTASDILIDVIGYSAQNGFNTALSAYCAIIVHQRFLQGDLGIGYRTIKQVVFRHKAVKIAFRLLCKIRNGSGIMAADAVQNIFRNGKVVVFNIILDLLGRINAKVIGRIAG